MLAAPRPILKRSSSSTAVPKHAHFPPPAMLTSTYVVYSPATYDRSPIVVAPNLCALPERGGRTYVLDDAQSHSRPASKATWPPRQSNDSSLPALIPDLSSESDESDAFPSPHLENQEFNFTTPNQHGLKAVRDDSLSFLPYSPSHPYCSSIKEDAPIEKVEKPKRRRERKHDASRDNNRIRSNDDLPRRKSSCSSTSSSPSFSSESFSSFTLSDDGCLGGF
ncbi:hypothetical protein AGABI1DRAFT_115667, partial [Agaricus bisporus var. burnettii JB137-S8]